MLRPVNPSQLEQCWPWVRSGLEAVRAKSAVDWTPGQVRERIETGNAHLWVCDEGFVIWTLQTAQFTGERIFLVWIAHGQGGGLVRKHWSQMRQLAWRCGASEMQVRSDRRGYERALPGGWDVREVTYSWRFDSGRQQ